jgi:hypothetical protein
LHVKPITGWMPKPYAYAIDGFLDAIGAYDDTTSALIRAALSNSFVLHPAVGWRPFAAHGFEATAGYTLITLGGALSGSDVVNVFLQESGSSERVSQQDSDRELTIAATMHAFQVTLGWRWLLLNDRLALRADVSYLQVVAASSSVALGAASTTGRRGAASTKADAALSSAVDSYLTPYLTTYVKTPVVGLSAAYRFSL